MNTTEKEMDKENKKRKPNWTEEEKCILLDEYGKRKAILKSKLNPNVTATKKYKQWEEITDTINARNLGVKRTVQEIIKKYENISVMAKKELSVHKRESNKTGGGPPPPELSDSTKMVQDIIGADSPVLAGITGGLESEAEPEEQHNTELSQQSQTQLQHRQSASTPNQAAAKKTLATREEVLELQKEVLQLQKNKLQLEIEKIKKEKENQDLYNFILNNKLLQLQSEGKVTITSVDK
ncbi:myb/SANT-like DNA-binding domain-containing protein 4 [Megalobrama amblycephala]|uniref:myb/SANT-like DNA-binding domain-containing protein 4 n=1 Tax=Megalobrama amblycephala TaxID=75352 RepID=UPI00201464CF|nr:myb/SANT-like DNA-binding domain-containing protein 4 [Megalobrama amblycephala]XP_048038023.1 myb/SANT-like DNA-binding domain-containing protein 4 [Megalobrama amblycephala]